MRNRIRYYSILAIVTLLLLISSFIGCGQSQSQIPQEDSKAGIAQSGEENISSPSTTSIPTDEVVTHFEQGNTYLEQDEYYEAIAEYTKAIELNPNFAEAYANRALASFSQKEYSLAAGNEYGFVIADYEKAIELNPIVNINVVLARAYVYRGDYYFEHALSDLDYEKAIADYTMAMKIDSLIKCRRPHDIYVDMAEDSLTRQKYDEAITYLTKAMELDPQNTEYYNTRLAEAYHGRGVNYYEYSTDREKAIADYTKAIELDPTNTDYYLSRAFVYDEWAYYYYDHGHSSEQRDCTNKAIADYTKVIELEPGVANYYYFRGRCYADNDDYATAITDYSRAIELGELGDLIANVYWARAHAYDNLDNNGGALTDYRKALELSEDEWTKEQILEDIEKLESKYVIPDLAYIRISVGSYTDDADPEADGITLNISFYDSRSEGIIFQGIPVTATINVYGYKYAGSMEGYLFPDMEKRELVYQEQATQDHSVTIGNSQSIVTTRQIYERVTEWEQENNTTLDLSSTETKIPFEDMMIDQNMYYKFGDIEVTVVTPKQGRFQATQSLVRLYTE